jgi:CRISPR-associated protein Csb2
VPMPGTLAALVHRHRRFLDRLAAEAFQPVPPLSTFATVGYHSVTVASAKPAAARPFAAFGILKPDASGNRAFDTPRRAREVAAWTRHAAGLACQGWPFAQVAAFVHGHDANGDRLKGDGADRRFMYLPLPTINSKLNRVEAIRRVLIVAPAGCKDQIDWVRRRLPGQELRNMQGQAIGLLNLLPTSDWVLRQYVGEARGWSTVTPVILPGHDDPDGLRKKLNKRRTSEEQKNLLERLNRRIVGLLHKAFSQAGLSPEQVNTIDELEWRKAGFRAGVDWADRYLRPDKLNGPQYHIRVRFRQPICGPLAVGAGRYRGLGVFAAEETG